MKKVTGEELVTELGCLEAMGLLIIRLIQFSTSYLDCSEMENAELHDLPTHSRFFILFSLAVCSEVQNFQMSRPLRDRMK